MLDNQRISIGSAREGAENASQQVRGCAAGTLTGREPARRLPPIGTFTAKWLQLSTPSGLQRLSRHDALSAASGSGIGDVDTSHRREFEFGRDEGVVAA